MTIVEPGPKPLRPPYLVLFLLGLAAVASCSDDDDETTPTMTGGQGGSANRGGAGGGGKGGTAGRPGNGEGGQGTSELLTEECAVLGKLCHAVDDDEGPTHDCHALGHVGEPTACHEQFPSCIEECLEDPAASGAGGAAGGRGVHPGKELGDPHCAALGELCHASDDEAGLLHDCHALGHRGDSKACRSQFDICASACLAALDAAGAPTGHNGGNGGAAGAGAHARPAGASSGGDGTR